MKVAIMQPYIFPYIGYFQLIHAVDTFVFYDDVDFIKGGWINRNKILVNGEEVLFTIPLSNPSSNKKIKDIKVYADYVKISKFLKTLKQNYQKAPYFDLTYKLVEEIINQPHYSIANMAIQSIKIISDYLDIKTKFQISSRDFPETKLLKKSERIVSIVTASKNKIYTNLYGGKHLYNKNFFHSEGILLQFLKPKIKTYSQFSFDFIPGLSIIDVMMFNSPKEIRLMLTDFEIL